MRREWEAAHAVTEELVEGPPSRRANATLTPCPNGNHLWCIGGEFFSEDNRAYFYNDVFRYSPEKDEWRKFVSPTCPGPRSAHAVVGSPVGGGKLFLFGGEFSSLNQTTFHHYRDFWCFDISTHSWDRIDTKVMPTARSGHRMAGWKHFIILFGGFYDPGITTRYLNDLWIFDTHEYKWIQVEFRENDPRPSPRSGFSFLPIADGIVLHGGYCKEYVKGKRPIGIMLEDTWFLRMTLNTGEDDVSTPRGLATSSKLKSSSAKSKSPVDVKWERRKRPSTAFAPPLRSGSTMVQWAAKNLSIMFGGVTDEDTNEETLESIFWNDMYSYQLGSDKGKWAFLLLRQPKQRKEKKPAQRQPIKGQKDWGDLDDIDVDAQGSATELDDPILTTPSPRYSAMLAILRNTLYIYGGIFERGSREYTLDDFYLLQLDKMERFVCLKKSDVLIPEGEESSSDSSDGEDGSESSDDNSDEGSNENKAAISVDPGEESPARVIGEAGSQIIYLSFASQISSTDVRPQDTLRSRATAFMGVSRDTTRSEEETISTPLPGETLSTFYTRSREYWAQKARDKIDSRGKMLRKQAFTLAKERYDEYKPVLREVERILAEAGLDEGEIKRAGAGGGKPTGESRSRR
ncbi:galactose oxidase [Vararia minispora EC-137]|uniref:Galactose oxidase n=1 Tax=Vararia minispora EC-137 TaxID=1314806 RepID=A0ACB8QD59_9AGAM|nr:galactose oxidase [Vararia minispora EC-137]